MWDCLISRSVVTRARKARNRRLSVTAVLLLMLGAVTFTRLGEVEATLASIYPISIEEQIMPSVFHSDVDLVLDVAFKQ